MSWKEVNKILMNALARHLLRLLVVTLSAQLVEKSSRQQFTLGQH